MNILNYTELVGGKKNGSPHDYPITKTHDDQHARSTIGRKLMAINDLTYSTIMDVNRETALNRSTRIVNSIDTSTSQDSRGRRETERRKY